MDKLVLKQIDEDIVNFFRVGYFGNGPDVMKRAVDAAYRDMNRTLRFKGIADEVRHGLRKEVLALFHEEIPVLISGHIVNQEVFNAWHRALSDRIKTLYAQKGIVFTYGHAQKWINMTIKYLYILEYDSFDAVFPYLHVPIDNIIFEMASKQFNLSRPKDVWSSWDEYEEQYLAYQQALSNQIGDLDPLRWEFRNWKLA